MTPALQAVLFGSAFYPGATVALEFRFGKYRAPGVNSPIGNFSALPNLTVTRATPPVAYAPDANGLLIPFAANTRRITSLGLLIEDARTNVVLWNRDLTNAAWTKTSITAALDQVGADGAVNSASSLTATGANGTALQAITLASSARFQSAWVKRITGSGVIQMTMDNGVTWTAITVTSTYTQLTIPTQTLANPTVGFRIVTSGDAIAVDFVQNENGAFVTSPIPATTVAVTRAQEFVLITLPALAAGTLIAKWLGTPSTAFVAAAELDDGTVNNAIDIAESGKVHDGLVFTASVQQFRVSAGGAVVAGASAAAGVSWSAAGVNYANSGGVTNTTGAITVPNFSQIVLGGRAATATSLCNFLQLVLVYPRAMSLAEIQAALR